MKQDKRHNISHMYTTAELASIPLRHMEMMPKKQLIGFVQMRN
jgi:hypothetical protein